jgi:hypothetical protein
MTEEIKTTDATATPQTVMPIGDIRIQIQDKSIVFAPADDITAKEVSLIFLMFFNGIMQREPNVLDFGAFIVKHSLQRHFAELPQTNGAKQ